MVATGGQAELPKSQWTSRPKREAGRTAVALGGPGPWPPVSATVIVNNDSGHSCGRLRG